MAEPNASGSPVVRGSPPLTVTRHAEDALRAITSARRPEWVDSKQWDQLSGAEQLRRTSPSAGGVQLARADVRNGRIFGRPERSDFPAFQLPNNVGAQGFSPGFFSHDYLVIARAPPTLRGPLGLAAIGTALIANPTPGNDRASTGRGTRNDVGNLVPGDGDTNLVRSYMLPSNNRRRSAVVVNYTMKGQHTMDEGFVLRFAELNKDQSITLVTYGEGNAVKQSFVSAWYWRNEVDKVWKANAVEIFCVCI